MQDFEKPENWLGVGTRFVAGNRWLGIVVRVHPFGVVVELPSGIVGLGHITDLIIPKHQTITDILDVGQVVEVQIIYTDVKTNIIGLAMKNVSGLFGVSTGLFSIQKSWFTENVVGIARKIREDGYRDKALVTILADALEEAGCDIEPLLAYCRDLSCAREWHGWWVAESILRTWNELA